MLPSSESGRLASGCSARGLGTPGGAGGSGSALRTAASAGQVCAQVAWPSEPDFVSGTGGYV